MLHVKRTLTPKQKEILDYVISYKNDHGYAPSLEEIGTKFELKAVSTVHQHVEALKKKGFLTKEINQPRGIQPLKETPETVEVPLLGFIAAGSPIEPIENPEPIQVQASMVNQQGQFYALKVKGDSMIDDGICDGDVVIIKTQQTANNGETIVALTEQGVTLKRYRINNNKAWLEPRNKKLSNIYPTTLEIKGKFVGLIRQ